MFVTEIPTSFLGTCVDRLGDTQSMDFQTNRGQAKGEEGRSQNINKRTTLLPFYRSFVGLRSN